MDVLDFADFPVQPRLIQEFDPRLLLSQQRLQQIKLQIIQKQNK